MKCPACTIEFSRRQDGCCPNCGEELLIHKGYAFRASDGAPNVKIVLEFEKLVSQNLSAAQRMEVPFRIPRKSAQYRVELAQAEKLLEMTDYDIDIVLRTLDVLFTNKRFSFKTRSSLTQVMRDWPVGMAIAKAIKQREATQMSAQERNLASVMSREDIFAS
jgi:hypothetical protein